MIDLNTYILSETLPVCKKNVEVEQLFVDSILFVPIVYSKNQHTHTKNWPFLVTIISRAADPAISAGYRSIFFGKKNI